MTEIKGHELSFHPHFTDEGFTSQYIGLPSNCLKKSRGWNPNIHEMKIKERVYPSLKLRKNISMFIEIFKS